MNSNKKKLWFQNKVEARIKIYTVNIYLLKVKLNGPMPEGKYEEFLVTRCIT